MIVEFQFLSNNFVFRMTQAVIRNINIVTFIVTKPLKHEKSCKINKMCVRLTRRKVIKAVIIV